MLLLYFVMNMRFMNLRGKGKNVPNVPDVTFVTDVPDDTLFDKARVRTIKSEVGRSGKRSGLFLEVYT